MSVIGLLVLPAKRGTAKNELRAKVDTMRTRLMEALTAQFDHELERSLQRLREAMGPYTRFVRSERERLADARGSLRELRERLLALRERVEKLGTG
jgi:chromosome segregation ATPase